MKPGYASRLLLQRSQMRSRLGLAVDAALAGLPARFAAILGSGYRERAATERYMPYEATAWLQTHAAPIKVARLDLEVSDAEICATAENCAAHVRSLLAATTRLPVLLTWAAASAYCESWRVVAPASGEGAIERMADAAWWRLQLRKAHARDLESAAIDLGLVHQGSDVYVSNESCERRRQQVARNRAILESVEMSDAATGEYIGTLQDAAELTVANKEIRRAELMTRMRGFDEIAKDLGHGCEFATLTAPSRMHKYRTRWVGKGRIARSCVPNRRYDGTKPVDAQAWHCRNWARARASLARVGIRVYGFRVVEPNHDGTPHWHQILFFDVPKGWLLDEVRYVLRAVLRRYWLEDGGSEPGAQKYRCKFEPIDLKKGSATGYIAKYISKNIDGYAVEKDLFGNDAITSSMRVEAWATTWRIRQFQQIGGAPVSVWRELRRVKSLPEFVPARVRKAFESVQGKLAGKRESWKDYTEAQGGPLVRRGDVFLALAKDVEPRINKYGESVPGKILGVCVAGTSYLIESVRKAFRFFQARARSAFAPWTRENNCTGDFENAGAYKHGEGKNAPPAGQRKLRGGIGKADGAAGMAKADSGPDSQTAGAGASSNFVAP